jgi:hypothetical protein
MSPPILPDLSNWPGLAQEQQNPLNQDDASLDLEAAPAPVNHELRQNAEFLAFGDMSHYELFRLGGRPCSRVVTLAGYPCSRVVTRERQDYEREFRLSVDALRPANEMGTEVTRLIEKRRDAAIASYGFWTAVGKWVREAIVGTNVVESLAGLLRKRERRPDADDSLVDENEEDSRQDGADGVEAENKHLERRETGTETDVEALVSALASARID